MKSIPNPVNAEIICLDDIDDIQPTVDQVDSKDKPYVPPYTTTNKTVSTTVTRRSRYKTDAVEEDEEVNVSVTF